MDRFLATLDGVVEDGDLRLCESAGVAWQADMRVTMDYGDAYFYHYAALEGSDVAVALNAGRCAMLARHAAPEAAVLDIGAGSGAFVRAARSWGFNAMGFDIIPRTVDKLKESGAYADNPEAFDVITFWDSLEHIPQPESVLGRIRKGAVVLVAIPIFRDLRRIRESKHYKPGEHLYYFAEHGFVAWMARHGFRLVGTSTHETDAGRESIGAYAFERVRCAECLDLPPCPCGGETYVDEFTLGRKPREFFLRCASCGGMGDTAPTAADAIAKPIRPEQAAEAA